jgi:protocatechuate 3,4-dioxygenase beta subunit
VFALRCALIAVAAVAPLAAGAQQQTRDAPPQPAVRRVPVGTGVITGTITAADTGRPLRGVRVSINGTSGPAATRMGGPGSAAPTLPGGVTVTMTMGVAQGRGAVPSGTSGPVSSMSSSRTAVTDAQGAFIFEHLPAGRYSVNASRNAFLTANYGQKKPGGPGSSLTLADGQKMAVTLQMTRGGVISGTVFGEDGEPVSNTQVTAWRYTMNSGIRRLQQAGGANTDDRGVYRLFGLQPGEYVVSSRPNQNDTMVERMQAETTLIAQAIASGGVQPSTTPGLPATVAIPVTPAQPGQPAPRVGPAGFVPVYHPSVFAARNATIVKVTGGDEHPFIDIQVQLAQASNIQGRVTNPPGPGLGVQLSLVNEDPLVESSMGAPVDANGQFAFMYVSPGKYTIMATVIASRTPTVVDGVMTQRVGPPAPLEDSQKWWGRESITVDGQSVVSPSVTLQPGRSISGQVIFDMARPPDLTRSKLMVSLQPAPGSQQAMFGPQPQALIGPDGRFTMQGVSPGRYQLRPGGGVLKSVMVNGEDALDFPFDVAGDTDISNVVATVTDQSSEITGTLTEGLGTPSPDFTLIAFAAEERFWTAGSRRIVSTRTGQGGQYMFRNLPPGAYLIAAVTELEQGTQYDPEFLRALTAAGATRVTVTDGGKLVQDLRIK